MESRGKQKVYFNDPQHQFIYTGAHTNVIVGGRRIGKTSGFASQFVLRNAQHMPRGNHAILVPSYKHGLTQTLPGTLEALDRLGYKRDIHYYIGHRPPKNSGFAKPYAEPGNFENIISWYNGSIHTIISQDRPGSSNSLTLDSIMIDEARFINHEKYKTETVPALGGYKGHFAHVSWHRGMLIMSDMPTSQKPAWFESMKDLSDDELISTIQAIVVEIWQLKKEYQKEKSDKIAKKIASMRTALAKLQSVAVYYREISSIENLLILGEKYFRQMKRDLPPLIFQSSILTKRIRIIKDGFYAALEPAVHYYTAFNNSYLDSLNYNFSKIQEEDCRHDADVDLGKPISIAFDYNANINWLVAGQRDGVKMKTIKSFYVKYERKLGELVKDFCKYYKHHRTREVIYYYDNTAIGTNYAVGDDDFASTITEAFIKENWKVKRIHIGNPVKHSDKHMMIHQALIGVKYLFPVFNKPNNEALIMAMENTGTRISSRGFGKDKSGEKLMESDDDLLEHRTDGTDAWDTLFIGMNKFPAGASAGAITSSWA